MRIIFLGAGQKLGLNVVTIDAKTIYDMYSTGTQNKDSINLFPLSYQNNSTPGMTNTANGRVIVDIYSPCILLIENMDSIIFPTENSEENSQVQNEENEIQEIFAKILEKFLDNLWVGIADAARERFEKKKNSRRGNDKLMSTQSDR